LSIESIKHHVKEEIEKVNQVLHLLEGGNQRAGKQATGVRKKRTLSAAGKARIAAAQRARWAKIRAGKRRFLPSWSFSFRHEGASQPLFCCLARRH
jgi:hypothetical protein